MKKRKFVLILSGIIIFILLYIAIGRHLTITGNEMLKFFQDDICYAKLEKTSEDENGKICLGTYYFTDKELQRLLKQIMNSEFREMRNTTFSVNTDIRYYISFWNSKGIVECEMKLYGADVLIFHYISGKKPAVHENYWIISTPIVNYFDAIIEENSL